jgi:integrase
LFFPKINGGVYQSGFFVRMFRELIGDLPEDITPHILRHSFASLGNDLGLPDATIAALIGHVGQTMTSRYQHAADAVTLQAADKIADETARLMGEAPAEAAVVPLHRA